MRNELQKLYLMLSKPIYTWYEMVAIVVILVGIFLLYETNTVIICDSEYLSKSVLIHKIAFNWFVALCSIFCLIWAKVIKAEELDELEVRINELESKQGGRKTIERN